MKENFKLGIILAIITSIAGVLLGLANGFTKDAIAENSKLNKEDLALIMPLATSVEETDKKLEGNILEILEGKNGSEAVGYLFKVNTKGFHGPVDLMIAISNEGKTTGLKVISHAETPGLGAKIDEDKFKERFKNIPINKGINIVKTTPTNENEVEGVTGATISSKAVGTAVNEAINYYKVNIQGEAPIDENGTDANSGASES
jgi:H+/Na+-translocating ferredoxin:NAD+ oxidoreductase subunit G